MATRIAPLFVQIANGSNSSSGADVSIVGAGLGSMSIPPGYPTVGKVLRLTARGQYSTVAVPGNLTVKVNLGLGLMVSTLAQALPASRTNQYWKFECLLTYRTIGVGGSILPHGEFFHMQTAGSTGNPTVWTAFRTAVTGVDTTAANLLDLLTNFDTAGNSITCTELVLEALN